MAVIFWEILMSEEAAARMPEKKEYEKTKAFLPQRRREGSSPVRSNIFRFYNTDE